MKEVTYEDWQEKKTALEKRIFELEKENEDLKNQIKGFENDFDYQNKIIDKYKEDLKKVACCLYSGTSCKCN